MQRTVIVQCSGWGSNCCPCRLRQEISNYLGVPELCAERATCREKSSTEAQRVICPFGGCVVAMFGHVERGPSRVNLCINTRPLSVTWCSSRGSVLRCSKLPKICVNLCHIICLVVDFAIRPAVFAAVAEIYMNKNVTNKVECEQLLARDDFRLYQGLRGGQTCAPESDKWYFLEEYYHFVYRIVC